MVLVGFILSYIILTAPNDKDVFFIRDYAKEIGTVNFKTEKAYDIISDYKSAAQTGKTAIFSKLLNGISRQREKIIQRSPDWFVHYRAIVNCSKKRTVILWKSP